MSHYELIGESALGPVEVLIGWNPTCEYCYRFIENKQWPPLYSCIDDDDMKNDPLAHYQIAIDSFGINNINLNEGSKLYDQLILDCLQNSKSLT